MYGLQRMVERWGALVIGIVLLALPAARGFAGSFGWKDIFVGGLGVVALLLALEHFLRRRELARRIGKPAARRGRDCPHCGEPLPEAA